MFRRNSGESPASERLLAQPDTPLSPSVLYALQYRGAEISTEELRGLADYYPKFALYGLGKIAWKNGSTELTRQAIESSVFGTQAESQIAAIDLAARIGAEVSTPSMKLGKIAEFSRKHTTMPDAYGGIADYIGDRVPMFMGHSTIPAIHHFVDKYDQDFGIILEHPQKSMYSAVVVSPSAGQVDAPIQLSQGGIDSSFLVIDDFYKTGSTLARVAAVFPDASFATAGNTENIIPTEDLLAIHAEINGAALAE